ncbi:hypothetical protein GCM10028824_41520 [Hymenobacter segetis]
MMPLLTRVGALLLLVGGGACSPRRLVTNHYYVLNDVPQRNMMLRLDQDGRYVLRNRVHGSLAFGAEGRWVSLAKGRLLLLKAQDSLGVSGTSARVAAPYGEALDLQKALDNRAYIFPAMHHDTVVVLPHHILNLHGYPFKLRR